MIKRLLTLSLLAGCGKGDWRYDAMATYYPEFDSKRLSHQPTNGYPPWKIEIVKMGEELETFVSLMRHRFSSSKDSVSVRLCWDGEVKDGEAFIFDGRMKIRFSDLLTEALIQALQEGKKVSILIDNMQETLGPDFFKENFAKLMKSSYDWEMHLQTPLK